MGGGISSGRARPNWLLGARAVRSAIGRLLGRALHRSAADLVRICFLTRTAPLALACLLALACGSERATSDTTENVGTQEQAVVSDPSGSCRLAWHEPAVASLSSRRMAASSTPSSSLNPRPTSRFSFARTVSKTSHRTSSRAPSRTAMGPTRIRWSRPPRSTTRATSFKRVSTRTVRTSPACSRPDPKRRFGYRTQSTGRRPASPNLPPAATHTSRRCPTVTCGSR